MAFAPDAARPEEAPVAHVVARWPPVVERPRPVRLSEHLYLVGGEKISHPFDASAYLVTGPRPVLIDCGSRYGWPAVRENMSLLGVEPSRLSAVFGSHAHFDHVSGYAEICTESDAPLLIHESDGQAAADGDRELTAAFLYGADSPELEVSGPLPLSHESGSVVVSSLHTPGHTPGSSCFVVRDGPIRVLLAADTLFGGFHPRTGSDIDDWAASLGLLAEEEFEYLSVGHAHAPLIADAGRVVAEARLQLGVYFNPWFRPFHLEFSHP